MNDLKPTRRDFLKSLGIGLSAAVAERTARSAPGTKGRAKPNLLIIHTDQQNCWTLGAYGGDLIATPNIDALAREGALFRNFFANSALCSPSRACFVTGRYPNTHGVYANNIYLSDSEVTFAHVLKRAGYATGYSGKWHLNGTPKPGWGNPAWGKPTPGKGFDDNRFMFNRGHWKSIVERPDGPPKISYGKIGDEHTYTTDWLAQKTIEFIERNRNRPFCYMVGIPDPHPPYTVRTPYSAMFDPKDLPLPATVNEREGRPARPPALFKKFESRLRTRKAHYCGMVKCIDDAVGKIVAHLRKENLLDDTIVVFTSDHGDYMGEHGLMGKNMLYETAHHIPLIIRWPRKIAPATVVEHIVTTVDFHPTILAIMGLSASGRVQGRDATPLLLGKKVPWNDECFIYHSSNKYAGILTPRYHFVVGPPGFHYRGAPNRMLYDRVNDPEQRRNLIDDPKYAGVRKELFARVLEHHKALDTPELSWLPSAAKG